MNLYFLVEGRCTEVNVYPQWLSYLLPHYSRTLRFDVVKTNEYFLLSGEGYPSLLDVHLPNAIADINSIDSYRYLVLCLDADEQTVADRSAEVLEAVRTITEKLVRAELQIIIQNRCIETWFLGNRRVLSRAPQSQKLRDFIKFHNVSELDPETMGCFPGHSTHAQFHGAYLQEMFREKKITYSKRNPGHVADQAYLDQLLQRTKDQSADLATFQCFIDFCREISAMSLPQTSPNAGNPEG